MITDATPVPYDNSDHAFSRLRDTTVVRNSTGYGLPLDEFLEYDADPTTNESGIFHGNASQPWGHCLQSPEPMTVAPPANDYMDAGGHFLNDTTIACFDKSPTPRCSSRCPNTIDTSFRADASNGTEAGYPKAGLSRSRLRQSSSQPQLLLSDGRGPDLRHSPSQPGLLPENTITLQPSALQPNKIIESLQDDVRRLSMDTSAMEARLREDFMEVKAELEAKISNIAVANGTALFQLDERLGMLQEMKRLEHSSTFPEANSPEYSNNSPRMRFQNWSTCIEVEPTAAENFTFCSTRLPDLRSVPMLSANGEVVNRKRPSLEVENSELRATPGYEHHGDSVAKDWSAERYNTPPEFQHVLSQIRQISQDFTVLRAEVQRVVSQDSEMRSFISRWAEKKEGPPLCDDLSQTRLDVIQAEVSGLRKEMEGKVGEDRIVPATDWGFRKEWQKPWQVEILGGTASWEKELNGLYNLVPSKVINGKEVYRRVDGKTIMYKDPRAERWNVAWSGDMNKACQGEEVFVAYKSNLDFSDPGGWRDSVGVWWCTRSKMNFVPGVVLLANTAT